MKRTMHLTLVASLLLIVSVSCNKQKQFPDDTADGKNVFGCYINGQKFLPCTDFLKPRLKTNISTTSEMFVNASVLAQNTCDNNYGFGRSIIISFDSIEIEENKTYKFGNWNSGFRGQVTCLYTEDSKGFMSDSSLTGTILVRKFDNVKGILAANFETTLKENNTGETRALTKGTFDVSQ